MEAGVMIKIRPPTEECETCRLKGSSIIVIIFTSVGPTQRTLGGGGQGRPYAFLNDVFLNVVMEIRK